MLLKKERIHNLLVHVCPECEGKLGEVQYQLHCCTCGQTFPSEELSKEYRAIFPLESIYYDFWEMSQSCLRVVSHLEDKHMIVNAAKKLTTTLSQIEQY